MAPGRSVTPMGYLFGVCPLETCSPQMLEHLLRALP